MNKIQLGRIYKRIKHIQPIGVYPKYIVLIGTNRLMKDRVRYRFIDMEWGQEPDSVLPDYDIRDYYELVDTGDSVW